MPQATGSKTSLPLPELLRPGAFALAAVLCVTGCHKKPAPPPAPPPPPPVKPSQPLPARQPGLWQTQVVEEGSADMPQIMQICIDAITDANLGVLGTDLTGDTCKTRTYSPKGDGNWGLLAECDMGSGVVNEYSGSISGDYTQDYTLKVRLQTTGGSLPQMNRVTNYIVTSKRVGVCPSNLRPGDVVNEGVKMNLFDMAGVKQSAGTSDAPMGDE